MSPLSLYTGLQNRQIGPLETVVLPVDSRISGISARQTRIPGGKDVTNAVVVWNGPPEALHVSSLIRYSNNYNFQYQDFLACVIAEGYAITYGDE
jgi:hypothetical protein